MAVLDLVARDYFGEDAFLSSSGNFGILSLHLHWERHFVEFQTLVRWA